MPPRARATSPSSPYNVVHLTLPDERAGRCGDVARVACRAASSSRTTSRLCGGSRRTTSGPTASRGARDGLVCALRLEPYANGVVLPHERTHAGPKEGRLRLLRALRAEVEPIFLLYDGALEGPAGDPDLDVELDGVRNRLWRVDGDAPDALADAQLVIADGHHRYETALAFHEEDGSEEQRLDDGRRLPDRQEGLTIFPTHRIAERLGPVAGEPAGVRSRPGSSVAVRRSLRRGRLPARRRRRPFGASPASRTRRSSSGSGRRA